MSLGHQAISYLLGLGGCFGIHVTSILGFSNAGWKVAVLVLRAILICGSGRARVATP